MSISAIRDVEGRIASLNTRFNHPMSDNGTPIDDEFHWDRWRGYTYQKLGFLARNMERETQGYAPVDTSSLEPNAIDGVDLNNVASSVGAESWLRYRDLKIGSMNQIRSAATGEVRWKSTWSRGAGHRLRRVKVDGQSDIVNHDGVGRKTDVLGFELKYDAANRLAEAHNPATGAFERYAYHGKGRLAYVYNSDDNAAQHFGYAPRFGIKNGARMAVAMDENYALLWQSFQGPELDLILEFHDQNQAIIPLIDHRRSIAGAWDMTDGFMVGIATYDAEGRVAQYSNDEALECNEVGNPGVNCNAPGGLPFGLNARWRSPMTGFVNMHHRWYSPRMGEFLSHDPLGYVDSYNLFGFATYDPINGYDPFGLERNLLEKAGTAVAGFGIGVVIGIVPGGWTLPIMEGNQFQKMSPELRESIGLGILVAGIGEVGGGGIIGTKGAFDTAGGAMMLSTGGGAPVGVVIIGGGVSEMALGLVLTAEGSADILMGAHLMSENSSQQQDTTGKKRPITGKEKAVTTRSQKNANLKRLGLENVNLRNKSYNSAKKSLEKAGFKPTKDPKYIDDPKNSRAFVKFVQFGKKGEKGATVVRWDPAKNGRKGHFHINGPSGRAYTSDGKAGFWTDRNVHIRSSGLAAPLGLKKEVFSNDCP